MINYNLKEVLNRLVRGDQLSRSEAYEVLLAIADQRVDPYQTVAFLTCYQLRSITAAELSGFRDAMLDRASLVDLSDMSTIDVCGTGGDGKNTFNISTVSSFVVAGAGYKVAKHGNSSVSSACGSSDVLTHLGYKFSNDRDKLRADLEKGNFCYMHAPLFHPATKHIAAIRKALKIKTFFNIMGPLLNPARPQYQLMGVFSESLLSLFQSVLKDTDDLKFAIVHSLDGYDEVSLTGAYHYVTQEKSDIMKPVDMGLQSIKAEELYGGETVEEASRIFTDILSGNGTIAQNAVVYANAALALQLFDPSKPIGDCIAEAKESIDSGRAMTMLRAVTA